MSEPDPYGDPRLVALYDVDNPDGPDHEFYRALADALDARTIVDLGCGTGILTVTLARPGRAVHGVDPSPTMLDYARRRPGGENVQWQQGDSSAIAITGADLMIMSGNTAQHILGDDWQRTLRAAHAALRPGGVLAFETRNPAARAWRTWTDERTTRRTADGPLTEWLQVTDVRDGLVTFDAHNVFADSGEHVVATVRLAFRDEQQLRADLAAAGFTEIVLTGGWDGHPVDPSRNLIIVRAVRDR